MLKNIASDAIVFLLILVAVGGFMYFGYKAGYNKAEAKWVKAYSVAAENYIKENDKRQRQAEDEIAKIRASRVTHTTIIQEAKRELAETDTAAVFSDDELRAISNLRRALSDRP